MRTKLGKSHFRRRKAKRVKQLFDKKIPVDSKGVEQRVKRLAPYLGQKGK